MKNYIIYINDHSGSMSGSKAKAAMADYNANLTAVVNATSREMQNTLVSVTGLGLPSKHGFRTSVQRQLVISNPHVLKPIRDWPTPGDTPLYDAIVDTIKYHETLPDANDEDVSFLVIVTTDGQEAGSRVYTDSYVRQLVGKLNGTGRWSFVARVPQGSARHMIGLGFPTDNVQEWDSSSAESLAKTTAMTTAAIDAYVTTRSTGTVASRSSNTFYTSVANVDTSKLTALDPSKFSLYVVPQVDNGVEVKDFILAKRQAYLVGAAFYQLTKTEPRVSPTKLILIREKSTGKVYAGPDARKMLGLDTVNNARLNPNHGGGGYDIFIQSESVNRKLVGGTGLLYWAEKGRPMTQADLDKYKGQGKPAVPAVVQLPEAPATGKPTANPTYTPRPPSSSASVDGKPVKFFATREDARIGGRALNPVKYVQDVKDYQARGSHIEFGGNVVSRWFVFL